MGIFLIFLFILTVDFVSGVRQNIVYNYSIPNDVYLNQSFKETVSDLKQFKIALITAGSIRSFLFVERSWQRYIIDPWKDNVHVFAHVVAPHAKCEILNKGIDALKEIATEFEVGYTKAPLLSNDEVGQKLGKTRSCLSIARTDGMKSGNILDMYARRAKAYHLAKSYETNNNITWSLIMFVRLDSAFYAPKIEFFQYHRALLNLTALHSPTIIIPYGCGFVGYCDRFAVGLPREMDVYFNPNQIYKAVDWAYTKHPKTVDNKQIGIQKFHIQNSKDCGSELMLLIWLKYLNNITQGDTIPMSTSFITLRSSQANNYCAMTRIEMNNNQGVLRTDKTVSYKLGWSPVPTGFDLEASPYERCGIAYKMNVTEVCRSRHCQCGQRE